MIKIDVAEAEILILIVSPKVLDPTLPIMQPNTVFH